MNNLLSRFSSSFTRQSKNSSPVQLAAAHSPSYWNSICAAHRIRDGAAGLRMWQWRRSSRAARHAFPKFAANRTICGDGLIDAIERCASVAVMQQFGSNRRESRHAVDIAERTRMTQSGPRPAERSFFRQPRLAQAFVPGRYVQRMLSEPFDGETGIDVARLRQGGLRLVHLAFERISRGQTGVHDVATITGVECLPVFVDRSFATRPTATARTLLSSRHHS